MDDPSVTDASFPFAAVVGHDDAKLALLLATVDPRIGGVLLRGDKGTAKSTLARGLAELRPGAPFVELPLGAGEDRVVGTVDVAAALGGDGWRLQPGLLERAHGGVLYVDEVNLLPHHLVDVLLDAAASGVGRVERDGFSHTYPARFVLIGSMNPEEGDLRPQLLDRFGLVADLAGHADPVTRADAVRRRLAFEADPGAFAAEWSSATNRLRDRLASATAVDAALPDDVVQTAAALSTALGIGTLRADLTLCRAATALARLGGDRSVTESHVRRVAQLALTHRRRRSPFDPGTLDAGEIGDTMDRVCPGAGDRPAEPTPNGHGGEPGDRASASGGPQDGGPAAGGDGTERPPADGGGSPAVRAPGPGGSHAGDEPAPDGAGASRLPAGGRAGASPAAGAPDDAGAGAGEVVPLRIEAAAGRPGSDAHAQTRPGTAPTVRPRPWRDGSTRGPTTGARVPADPARPSGLAVAATAVAGVTRRAVHGGAVLAASDIREPVAAPPVSRTLVVALDTSGSMGAQARIAAAREAVLRMLLDAYQRRERVAVVAVGGEEPTVALQPTSSVEVARARLAQLAPAGPTPLAAGITMAAAIAVRARAGGGDALVVLLTDGRATASDGDRPPFAAALDAADRVAAEGLPTVVVDAGRPDGLGLAAQLAARLGARHLHLDALTAVGVEQALRRASSADPGR